MKLLEFCAQKINISIYDNTITFYFNLRITDNFFKIPYSEIYDLKLRIKSIGKICVVHKNDWGHEQYHQDKFSPEDRHCHYQFDKPIDEKKLIEIAMLCHTCNVLSQEERNKLISAYINAEEIKEEENVEHELSQEGSASTVFSFVA